MFLFQDRNNEKIWNFHSELFLSRPLYIVLRQSSKLSFRDVHEGDYGIVLQNTIKMQYLGLRETTFVSVLFSLYILWTLFDSFDEKNFIFTHNLGF
jgi:hypothetical protein